MFLIVLLQSLLTVAGAGTAAYKLINYARATWTTPPAHPAARLLYNFTHAPQYTRFTAYMLSIAISLSAAGLIALIAGQPIGPALEHMAAQALGAAWFSQMLHGATLDKTTPHDRTQQQLDAEARSMAASGSTLPPIRAFMAPPPRLYPVTPDQATDGQPEQLEINPEHRDGYTIKRRLSPEEIREILARRKKHT